MIKTGEDFHSKSPKMKKHVQSKVTQWERIRPIPTQASQQKKKTTFQAVLLIFRVTLILGMKVRGQKVVLNTKTASLATAVVSVMSVTT